MVDWVRKVEVVQEMPGPSVTVKHHGEVVSSTSQYGATNEQDVVLGPK